MTKKQMQRKAELDRLMIEYDYKKNDTQATIDFLVAMHWEYCKIVRVN